MGMEPFVLHFKPATGAATTKLMAAHDIVEARLVGKEWCISQQATAPGKDCRYINVKDPIEIRAECSGPNCPKCKEKKAAQAKLLAEGKKAALELEKKAS